jgi:hypothetical protein
MKSILYCLLLASVQASAQVVVRINDNPPVTIAPPDLASLPRHTAVLNDHGKHVSYEGPLLRDLLTRAGVSFGEGLRGKQRSTYVAALGSDGYEVVFALADLDPTVIDSNIIVADKREGGSLEKNEQPLRIILPNDKRPTRSVRMLQEIDLVQLRK